MKTAALISKPGKAELSALVPEVLRWLDARGYEVWLDRQSAAYAPMHAHVCERDAIAVSAPEFVLVLGGDGTLLAAARAVNSHEVPLLAVNLGSLGFLTEVRLDELYETLTEVVEGRAAIESRSLLDCRLLRDGQPLAQYHALNDAVVKSTVARLLDFEICANGEHVVAYQADGVILATPTGSTAYSLAAGGPVLMPTVDAIVLTPICPHSLTHRPLVVPSDATISVCLHKGSDGILTVDGQVGMPVRQGDQLICQRADYQIKLISKQRSFFDVLRSKLRWGQR